MVGFGGMKSAAEPVIAATLSVQGAFSCFVLARRVGALGFPELAVLLGFIMLLAFLAQAMPTVALIRAVRRSALGDPLGRRVVAQALSVLEKLRVGLLALLTLGVGLLAFLDVSVVSHVILSLSGRGSGKPKATRQPTAGAAKIPAL
jgi:hypothetical protein